ncbi:hypothetical protein E4T44_12192, partial [Aureobasidium sp. EXF-8845]
MHQLTGHDEHFAHGTPLKRPNVLPGPEHDFVDRSVPPPDQRPPLLGYTSLLEPRAEHSNNFSQDPHHFGDRWAGRLLNGKNLNLRNMTNTTSMPEYNHLERGSTDSPSQRAQSVHSVGPLSLSMYPPPRPEDMAEDAVSPTRTDRLLPSFHQLSKIADSGTESSDTRTTGLPTLTAYATQGIAQTVTPSHSHFPPSQQSSPSTNFMILNHPSPTDTRIDGHDMYARSASFSIPNHGNPRRKSSQHARPPPFIPSMTSSSVGTASSTDTMNSLQSRHSIESGVYSTSHTTPMGSASSSLDGTSKSSAVPRLQSSTSAAGGFLCDHPGCAAPPFQTQYLLNSHANVHSSSRPHYCPVKGCPRGEGGKGFKRKNEMIRHGLVHDSPGYVCPFCPLREHRYPRPDNLQ